MAFPFAPKIVYNAGANTLLLQNSSGMWTPDRMTQGGATESGAAVPETYVLRKDGLLTVAIRFAETELAAVVGWVDWCHDSGSLGYFDFYPDQAKTLHYQSWLLKPKVGDRWDIRRVPTYVKVLELDIELRTRTVGTMFDIPVV